MTTQATQANTILKHVSKAEMGGYKKLPDYNQCPTPISDESESNISELLSKIDNKLWLKLCQAHVKVRFGFS